ncbi:MAG: 1-acyl-sn-glycerol-3-phosphate acyltransferase [Syntrophomonadaceae bacterium]|nr:1-acyl-sn-glycerol-3-phosphate acyltransferase [Syntrophomonadaceae bacterium]
MLYYALRGILKFIFFFLGLKSEGIHNIPKKGPVIIASNHVSNWDPIVVALVVHRPVYFMAKEELFRNMLSAKFFSKLHAFPVKRGVADRKAIKCAIDLLKQGKLVGIFPEGRRSKEAVIQAQAGVAMIALKSKAPVIPVACLGTDRKLPLGWFRPLVVRAGKAINVEKYAGENLNTEVLEKVRDEIVNEINVLLSK